MWFMPFKVVSVVRHGQVPVLECIGALLQLTVEVDLAAGLSLAVLGQAAERAQVLLRHVQHLQLHLDVVERRLARHLRQLELPLPAERG